VFLLTAGVLSQRSWTLTRRQYQAAAWTFMLSLLFGALVPSVQADPTEHHRLGHLRRPLRRHHHALAVIALCGLVSMRRADDSSRS
jgi:hypothetical protein